MELEQYIRLFRRRLWIILLATILAGSIAFVVRATKAPTYRAGVLISIGRTLTVANPDTLDLAIPQDLAQTYIELLRTNKVLQATITTLKLPFSVTKLRNEIDANLLTNTSLLTLGVTDTDPETATKIANELANQLISNSPTNLTKEQLDQLSMAQGQVQTLNTQIAQNRERLTDIENQISHAKDDSALNTLNAQRNILLDQIDRATNSISQFSATIATLQDRRNSIEILEQAQVPSTPEDSGAGRISLLGAVLGGGFAAGVILLIEFWDTSVKTAKDVSKLLDVPVLGTIIRYGKNTDTYAERLVSRDEVHISVFERYRGIEAYLSLAARRTDVHKPVFIITSAEPGEGKSINASNLAFVAAAMGRRVLLIDADLRHPKIHEIFKLNNDAGLVTLLAATMSLKSSPENMSLVLASNAQTTLESALINPCVQRTSTPNLSVITAGPASVKSLQLLESDFLPRWIEIFKFYLDVDMIIIDTPPCMVVTDATILAGSIPSNVVLVAEAGRTRPETLTKAKLQFAQLGSSVIGVILNKANPQDDSPTKKYNYYLTETTETQNVLILPESTNRT